MQQKMPAFTRCRVFAKAALHGKPFLTEVVPRRGVLPAMVRARWQRIGTTRRWGTAAVGATKSQHPKTGVASQTTGVWSALLGWMRSLLHFSRRLAISGFSKSHESTHAHGCRVFDTPHQPGGRSRVATMKRRRWQREKRLMGFAGRMPDVAALALS